MRIQIRIQILPPTFSQIWTIQNDPLRLPPFHFDADPDPSFPFDPDPDPAFHFDADPDPASQKCWGRIQIRNTAYLVENLP